MPRLEMQLDQTVRAPAYTPQVNHNPSDTHPCYPNFLVGPRRGSGSLVINGRLIIARRVAIVD